MAFYLGKDKQKITISEAMLSGGTTRPVETKEVAYNKNGTYEIKPTSGYVISKVDVTVGVPPKEEQSKSKDITENGTYTITPDKNKVLSEAKVNVNIQPIVEPLIVDTNDTYIPRDGVDGFSSVEVNVPSRYQEGYDVGYQRGYDDREPILETLEANENIEYTPKNGVDGFDKVIVNVPLQYDDGFEAGRADGLNEGYEIGYQNGLAVNNFEVATLEVRENNITYDPKDYNVDGFDIVNVAIPEPNLRSITVTENNKTYTPSDDIDGFSEVIVDIPQKTEVDLEETITENHKTFTYEPEDGETFKKVTISVNVPTEIEGEFNGVALLAEDNLPGDDVYYHIYDNGWAIIDGVGGISDCEGYKDDPFGTGQNMNPASPFWNYSSITHVYIADGITSIGGGLFANCSNIEEVRLPDSLTSIGTCAFENTSITKVYIPESVYRIEENAFMNCNDLTDVYYGGTKSEWDEHELHGFFLSGLEEKTLHCKYEIPEDIQGEFNGVALLESGKCGENINYNIYDNGWVVLEGAGDTYDYSGYWDIDVLGGVTEIVASPFWDSPLIKHVYISDGITRIGSEIFVGLAGVREVRLPEGLDSIGLSAFECTDVTKIYIPNSITHIDSFAFGSIPNLEDIYYNGTKTEWDALWGEDVLEIQNGLIEVGLVEATLHCEYEDSTTETWTFEMKDGSIVTKEVEVI